ncbi:hypothetical protein D3C84_655360 [compost metagenome]
MHQLQGELEGSRQGRIEVERNNRDIDGFPHLVAAQDLLDSVHELLAGAVLYHFEHHVQRTVRTCTTDPVAVQYMGVAGHTHLGKELGHHRATIRVECAVMAIEQPRFSQEVATIPEPTQHRTSRIGVPQLSAQYRVAFEADTKTSTHDDDVLVPFVQIAQGAVSGDGNPEVAQHQIALAPDDQDLEHRCRTHQVGRDQGIHRAGERHHRKMLAQDEGHAAHRCRQPGTTGPVQMCQVLALQDTFE